MIAETYPQAPARLMRGRSCWLWIVPRCPRCGKRHQHGGGPLHGDPRRLLGHRAGHCEMRYWGVTGGPGGYDLIDLPQAEGAA